MRKIRAKELKKKRKCLTTWLRKHINEEKRKYFRLNINNLKTGSFIDWWFPTDDDEVIFSIQLF